MAVSLSLAKAFEHIPVIAFQQHGTPGVRKSKRDAGNPNIDVIH